MLIKKASWISQKQASLTADESTTKDIFTERKHSK